MREAFNTGGTSEEQREQRDFILRLIRQVIQALAAITSLRHSNKPEQALVELHEGYRSLLDIEPEVLPLIGDEVLIQTFSDKGQLEPLALLLWEEGRIRADQRQLLLAERLKRRSRALLYKAIANGQILTEEARGILEDD